MNQNRAKKDAIRVRTITVMADYHSSGLWDGQGRSLGVDEVPMSESLRLRLKAWCDWYEGNHEYLGPNPKRARFPVEAFTLEGRLIAVALKREHPDWVVRYYDEVQAAAGREHPVYEVGTVDVGTIEVVG